MRRVGGGRLKTQLRENSRQLDRTVETERHKAYEELARVRTSMAAVLDRERRIMRAQLVKATREVRSLIQDDNNDVDGDGVGGGGGGGVGRRGGYHGHAVDTDDSRINIASREDGDDEDVTAGINRDYDNSSEDGGEDYRYGKPS